MKTHTIAVLAGDGIGPEVVDEAIRVLRAVEKNLSAKFELTDGFIGGAAYEKYGSHFPQETINICRVADAIFYGSVGGPVNDAHLQKWKDCEKNALLGIRKEFGFFANLRSLRVPASLSEISPLKSHLLTNGLDILVIRELLGDVYFGPKSIRNEGGDRIAEDTGIYTEYEIKRVARVAFERARGRKGIVTSVDKANVLEMSRLWRSVVSEVHQAEFPDVTLQHILVDNCAMQLVRQPSAFDLLLTPNLFGDILSDLVSVFGGSLGLMPSASLNEDGKGLYEPAGGSAPDIAGKGIANPIAQILSLAMMLRISFGYDDAATRIEKSVDKTLAAGIRTKDLTLPNEQSVGTKEFTDNVIENL